MFPGVGWVREATSDHQHTAAAPCGIKWLQLHHPISGIRSGYISNKTWQPARKVDDYILAAKIIIDIDSEILLIDTHSVYYFIVLAADIDEIKQTVHAHLDM